MANPFDQFDQPESNPFDRFDASASAGSNPFDQFDGEENYGNEHKRTRLGVGDKPKPSAGQWLGAVAEAGASTMAGMPAMIAGGLVGAGSLLAGKGAEEAQRLNEYVQKSNFGLGAYEPTTKLGKEYAENVGKAMNKPIEWAGEGGEMLGGSAGRMTGEIAAGTLANLLPLGIPKGVQKGISKFGSRNIDKPVAPVTKADAIQAAVDAKKAKEAMDAPVEAAQRDLFPAEQAVAQQATEGLQGPSRPLPEALVPPMEGSGPTIRQDRRQMELPMETEALPQYNVTREGVALNPSDTTAMMARDGQMDAMRQQLDAERAARMREEQPHNVTNDMDGQADLFESGNPTPYTLADGQWHVDENGMPIRSDLSMEANNLEAPLQRNLFGDELGPALEQERSLTAAIDSMNPSPERMGALERLGDVRTDEAILDATARALPGKIGFNKMNKKQGGAVGLDLQVRRAKEEAPMQWFTASPEAGRKTGYSLEEQTARPNAEGQRYGPGQYISASRDFSSVYGGPEGRMYTVDKPFERPFNINSGSNEKVYQRLVEASGSRAGANAALKRAGYDAITFTSPRGDKLANIFNAKELKDIGPAREKIREQTLEIAEYEPGRPASDVGSKFGGKQGGWIRFGGDKKPAIDQIKKGVLGEAFKNFRPDDMTPEQFLEAHKATPDIDQNFIQRGFNYATKGGDYMVEKTNNPLIKRVVDQFRGADQRAKGLIQTFVHDNYAKKLRSLSKQEYTDVWQALKSMEAGKVKLTDEELVNAGYSLKERDMIKTHQDMMELMQPKVEAAMKEAGMGTFRPEVAYVAAKATGNFRKLVYKTVDGEKQIAGVIGANTRRGLEKQVKQYTDMHPDYTAGPEMTFMQGGKGRLADGFEDMLRFLSDADPTVKEFVERSKDLMNADVQNYRGAKTHTMQKKGVEGMAGNKPWEDAYTNAKEGFDAQVGYLNRMLEFGEKAKAVADVKSLLAPDNGLNMPKAKAYAKDYMDLALGRNPTAIGRWVDQGVGILGEKTGLGTNIGGEAIGTTRRLVNAKLLSLNPLYLLANFTDPIRNSPGIYAYLEARGVKTGTLSMMHNVNAVMDQAKLSLGLPVSDLIKGAKKYAEENHVYASDLYEHSNSTRRSVGDAIMDGLQKPGAAIEGASRQNVFFSLVNMLGERNGMKPNEGLYYAAHRATDMIMNSYSTMDSPMGLQAMGSAHKLPYNLMSYKFNQLSQISMLARDVKNNGAVKPVLTALAMQVAFGGLMGTIAYKEADYLFRKITEAMGNPNSLTKLLLDNADKKVQLPLIGDVSVQDAAYGGFSRAGGDMSSRMGMGFIALDPEKPLDSLAPGAGALGDAAVGIFDYAKDPQSFNAAKAVRNVLPNGLQGAFDRKFFSKTNSNGQEMGINPNKATAGVVRNEADKAWKTIGGTGVNESRTKAQLFENQRIDKFYEEKRKQDVLQMSKSLFMDGKIDPKYIKEFTDHQGDMTNFDKTLETLVMNQSVPADKADLLRAAAQQNITGAGKMKRRFH